MRKHHSDGFFHGGVLSGLADHAAVAHANLKWLDMPPLE
jgi:acyl-coenzyme A thioesterase PaaI-like protein